MKKRDPLSLVFSMGEKEKSFRSKQFLAPFTGKSRKAIVKMDGLNYEFDISGHKGDGIGIFQPHDFKSAKFVSLADFDKIRSYFDILPRFILILGYECEYGWICTPFHKESATGLNGEVIVKNVSGSERFDVIVARFDGVNFWFDEQFVGANVIKSEMMRSCFVPDSTLPKMLVKLKEISGVTPEDICAFELAVASWKVFKKVSDETRIQNAIAIGGGKLGRYVIRGDMIEIDWKSQSGAQYKSLVQKETLDVVSAGICLSGEDTKFHLKDLPFIIDQGEKRRAIYVTGIARAFDMSSEGDDDRDDDYYD